MTIAIHGTKGLKLGADDPRVARAIFTLRETAAYLDIPRSTVGWWASQPRGKHPLITRFPRHGREATVPFIGFAEAFVLASFRRAGVPLQRIRPALEVLTKEIGIEHALASERLYTDGCRHPSRERPVAPRERVRASLAVRQVPGFRRRHAAGPPPRGLVRSDVGAGARS